MDRARSQASYDVRLDWGPAGFDAVADDGSTVVVVDVLSFSTTVDVAVGLGTIVIPTRWRDGRAPVLAAQHDAALAVGRHEVTADCPWSLSPASLLATTPPPRLVLPSPNGATIASAAGRGVTVVAACLRHADRVAAWLAEHAAGPIAVIAAGERWPDGSLRPALEDQLGAGAVVSALVDRAPDRTPSPEAVSAASAFASTADVPAAVRTSASGRELFDTGFADDVEMALDLTTAGSVPVLTDGAFAPSQASEQSG